MRVALALPTLSEGDAVGNDVFGMAGVLRGRGCEVACFARNGQTAEPIRPPEELADYLKSPSDLLVYHHSIGCDWGVQAAVTTHARVAVKYHNVTPPRFFLPDSPEVAAGCQQGLDQVARLARSRAAVWADSDYNGLDFRAVAPGKPVHELPPFTHADALIRGEVDQRAVVGLDDWALTILVVGRLVANKNVPLAVETLAEVRRRLDPRARLVVVGDRPLAPHARAVEEAISAHGQAGHVFVTGKVSSAQLKSLYLLADVLLVTSHHEGFCVPITEAMGLGVPVVAVPNAAIPGTGGDAVRYAGADPVALAGAVGELVSDATAQEKLVLAGRARFEAKFTHERVRARFETLLDDLLNSPTGPGA